MKCCVSLFLKFSYLSLDFLEFRLAAMQGNAKAQIALGLMHEKGYGVTQNVSEALNWYRLAADQGNLVAQKKLLKMEQGNAINDSKTAQENKLAIVRF